MSPTVPAAVTPVLGSAHPAPWAPVTSFAAYVAFIQSREAARAARTVAS